MRGICILAVAAALAACGGEPASEPADETAAADEASPAADEVAAPAAAEPGDAGGAAAGGDRMIVTQTAECFEVGPDADDMPWTMAKGVHVTVLGVEGDKSKVTGAAGVPCLIDSKVLGPE